VPSRRAAFGEAFSTLLACAGDPLLQTVANSANEAQWKLYPGAPAVTKQRLSDWRQGKLPQRFESIEFTIRVLIGSAKKKGTPPPIAGLYDLRRWRRWWREARNAPSDEAGEPPQPDSIPNTSCRIRGWPLSGLPIRTGFSDGRAPLASWWR
jgi:hypothetical protein